MAAPAFGFSIGDFVTAIKLLDKAAKALREASEATSQFHQAAVELKNIHDVLISVQVLASSGDDADSIRKIHLCARTCYIPLSRFIDKLIKLEPHFGTKACLKGPSNLSAKLQTAGRKLQWAFILDKEVAKLKQQLGPQFTLIGAMLQLESLKRTVEFGRASEETAKVTNRRMKSMLELLEELKTSIASEPGRRNEAEDVERLISRFSISQLVEVVMRTESTTSELHSKMDIVQAILGGLKQQIDTISPSSATPYSQTSTTLRVDEVSRGCPEPMTSKGAQNTESVAITGLLSIVSSVRFTVEQIGFMLLLLLPAFEQIVRAMKNIVRSPTWLLDDNIHLEDALGRSLSLPYQHFQYWPVFFARLQEAFVGLPGESKVNHGEFHITNTTMSNFVLAQESWNRAVFPGSKLVMSMLYRSKDLMELLEEICLRCQSRRIVSRMDVWKSW